MTFVLQAGRGNARIIKRLCGSAAIERVPGSLGFLLNAQCPNVRDGINAGKVDVVAPVLSDVMVNGERLRVNGRCAGSR